MRLCTLCTLPQFLVLQLLLPLTHKVVFTKTGYSVCLFIAERRHKSVHKVTLWRLSSHQDKNYDLDFKEQGLGTYVFTCEFISQEMKQVEGEVKAIVCFSIISDPPLLPSLKGRKWTLWVRILFFIEGFVT